MQLRNERPHVHGARQFPTPVLTGSGSTGPRIPLSQLSSSPPTNMLRILRLIRPIVKAEMDYFLHQPLQSVRNRSNISV